MIQDHVVATPPKSGSDPQPAPTSLDAIGAVLDALSDALILLDHDGVVVHRNQVAQEMLGVDIGRNWHQQLEELVATGHITGQSAHAHWLDQAASGKEVTFYLQYQPLPETMMELQCVVTPIDLGGQRGLLVTIRDISQLVEKTREANELNSRTQQHSRQLSDLADLSTLVGTSLEQIYQRFLGKLVGLVQSDRSAIYIYKPNKQQLQRVATTSAASYAKNYKLNGDQPVAKAFRTRKPALTRTDRGDRHNTLAVPVSFDSKLHGVIVVSRKQPIFRNHDVRLVQLIAARLAVLLENSHLYHEVNARRERWEAVFNSTGNGVVAFDQQGKITAFNPAISRLIGWGDNEVIGKPFASVMVTDHNDDAPQDTHSAVRQILAEAAIIRDRPHLLRTKSGDSVWTEITYSPITGDDDEVQGGVAVVHNLQKDRELEMVQRDFISIASHEMRTPLSAIKGFLSMLIQKDVGELNGKQEHFLQRVYQSNQRMINLVEDLLDASYIDSGKIRLNIAPLAVEPIVSEVVAELSPKGVERQIMVKVKRRQRLPMVLADETRLRQVIINLVDNAIKYSMPGGEVAVQFKVEGDKLVISVVDKGVGLASSQIDRLFQKFGRVYNPMSVQAGGTGLGLYIVKNLVDSLGGEIWVTSREGKGSKFSFTLPLAHQLPLLDGGA